MRDGFAEGTFRLLGYASEIAMLAAEKDGTCRYFTRDPDNTLVPTGARGVRGDHVLLPPARAAGELARWKVRTAVLVGKQAEVQVGGRLAPPSDHYGVVVTLHAPAEGRRKRVNIAYEYDADE